MHDRMLQLNVRVNEREKSLLRQLATRDGLSMGNWVRNRVIVEARQVGLLDDGGQRYFTPSQEKGNAIEQ